MDQRNEAVQQFCGITASTPEQAHFFLESSGWQVEVALQNFYDHDAHGGEQYEDADEEEEAPPLTHAPTPTPLPAPGPVQGVGLFPPASRGAGERSRDKKPATGRGSIRTLSDFNRRSDSDSEEDTQEYYTGGEKSGMMVQDPQKGNRVDAIFEQARRMGAQQGPPLETSQARSNSRSTFTGMGRTLTGEVTQQGREGLMQQGHEGVEQRIQPPDPIIRNITFWRNGFTVDDGPLRRLEDPANAEFLRSIGNSECPKELEPKDRNTPVHVNLMRREDEWTPPPEPRNVPFQGVGRTLGSTSTTTDIGNMPSTHGASNQASQGLTVDSSRPVTSIQLRLSDGTRMVAQFNHHHTVADIRSVIDAARPGHARNYQLQTMGFPPKVLSDVAQTIEAAGLANAVVIQKA